MQRTKIEQWCQLHDYQLANVYEDAGLSGAKTDRPGLEKALADLQRGDVLIVYGLSRLSRSLRHVLELADRIAKKGADLCSLSEAIDTTSPGGRFTFHLFGALNQFQREMIAKNTSDALKKKLASGEAPGGHAPYGLKLVSGKRDGKKMLLLSVHRVEQKVLQRVHRLKSRGFSLRGIAFTLTKEGYKPRGGKTWHPQTVANILKRQEANHG